ARKLVITDESFRNGRINWAETTGRIIGAFPDDGLDQDSRITITQGFIGSSLNGQPVTLGREGSDFSAAIFAYALDATEMIIWKDVPGVLNADPRYFSDTVKLDRITYRDAIELAYFGASVIHPKTIQPLQNKEIPLYVRSFTQPNEPGTMIHNFTDSIKQIPSYICKSNQVLVSISPKDFSFIAEESLHTIFGLLSHMGIRTNMMQNSAISFSICIDDQPEKLHRLFTALGGEFRVKYNQGLELITIRHYNQKTIDKVVSKRKILLEQKSRLTVQLIVESPETKD
ncbi:MAG: aspartate kinase, partial [Lentimicrobium sp.]|nr:aspartate kinase [Lentimicrobium sp.]